MVNNGDEKVEENIQNVDDDLKFKLVEKSFFYREESNYFIDFKEIEWKVLVEFKLRFEEVILGNIFFKLEGKIKKEKEKLEREEKVEENFIKEEEIELKEEVIIEEDEEIFLWGVFLLFSKGLEGIDVILLKFLRVRDFKVNEVFEMLKKIFIWRVDLKIELVLDEDLGVDFVNVVYMKGIDCENYLICYNIFGVFGNEEFYQKIFGIEEN